MRVELARGSKELSCAAWQILRRTRRRPLTVSRMRCLPPGQRFSTLPREPRPDPFRRWLLARDGWVGRPEIDPLRGRPNQPAAGARNKDGVDIDHLTKSVDRSTLVQIADDPGPPTGDSPCQHPHGQNRTGCCRWTSWAKASVVLLSSRAARCTRRWIRLRAVTWPMAAHGDRHRRAAA